MNAGCDNNMGFVLKWFGRFLFLFLSSLLLTTITNLIWHKTLAEGALKGSVDNPIRTAVLYSTIASGASVVFFIVMGICFYYIGDHYWPHLLSFVLTIACVLSHFLIEILLLTLSNAASKDAYISKFNKLIDFSDPSPEISKWKSDHNCTMHESCQNAVKDYFYKKITVFNKINWAVSLIQALFFASMLFFFILIIASRPVLDIEYDDLDLILGSVIFDD